MGTRLVEESGRAFPAEEGLQAGNALRAWETKAVEFKVQGEGRGGGGEGRGQFGGPPEALDFFPLCLACLEAGALGVSLVFLSLVSQLR